MLNFLIMRPRQREMEGSLFAVHHAQRGCTRNLSGPDDSRDRQDRPPSDTCTVRSRGAWFVVRQLGVICVHDIHCMCSTHLLVCKRQSKGQRGDAGLLMPALGCSSSSYVICLRVESICLPCVDLTAGPTTITIGGRCDGRCNTTARYNND